MFFGGRYLTEDERRKIKQNMAKEKMEKEYLYHAKDRMQPRRSEWKMRGSDF